MTNRPRIGADHDLDSVPVEPLDPVMVAEVLEALALRQEAVERAVDSLSRRLGTTPKDGPWAWRTLSPSGQRALLTQLRDWIDWLVSRYQLRGETVTIAPCWYQHPAAVEELTALMVAWHAAYSQDEAAPTDLLINWHDRWLWPTLHRLNNQLRICPKCTGGSHETARPTPKLTGETAFDAFLQSLAAIPSTNQSPSAGLSRTDVEKLLTSGHAVSLLPDDPLSPVQLAPYPVLEFETEVASHQLSSIVVG